MNPLAKVTDGADASALMREGAFSFFQAAPWIALYFGSNLVDSSGVVAVLTIGVALGAGWLFARLPDRERQPEPGVWLVTRKGRWRRRLADVGPFLGLGLSLALAVIAGVRREPAWELVYLFCVAMGFGAQALLAMRAAAPKASDIELRIDAQGLHARQLGGTLAWSEIQDVQPRRRGDRKLLRLVVGPNTLLVGSEARRLYGGVVDLNLANACVTRETALEAMASYWAAGAETREVFVQPIEGVYVDEPPNEEAALGPVLVGAMIAGVATS